MVVRRHGDPNPYLRHYLRKREWKKKKTLLDPQPCLTLSLNFHSLNLSQQHKPQRPSCCDTLIVDAHQKSRKETGILTVAPKPIIAKAHKHTPQRLTADIKSSQQGGNQTSSQKNCSWPIKKWSKQSLSRGGGNWACICVWDMLQSQIYTVNK